MRWQIECALDSCKALLPYQATLRRIKYRLQNFSGTEAGDSWVIQQGLSQIDWVRSFQNLPSSTVLEIGSGWQPIIPVLYSLAGTGKLYLTDANRLCTLTSFQSSLASLRNKKELILSRLAISGQDFESALSWLDPGSVEEAMQPLRMEYLAPCDCRALPLTDASVDVIMSRAVLEHIPPSVVEAIFRESQRVLKRGGLACHFIDNSDHWEHRDKSLSRVNFLKYSDRLFRWTYLNPLNYQNRMRHPEYIAMVKAMGFRIIREERIVDPQSLEALKRLRIAERFRRFTAEDLATVTTRMLVRKIC